MNLHADCGLSFTVWWVMTVGLELFFSGCVSVIAGITFGNEVGKKFQFTYTPSRNTSNVEKNDHYTIVVTSWILVILVSLCVLRALVSVLLGIGIKKSSSNLCKLWIAFKVLALMMSFFLFASSFTVSKIITVASSISVIADLITAYFIRVLYPELDKMRKLVLTNPKAEKN